MDRGCRNLRSRLLGGATAVVIALVLGASPAAAQLTPVHSRCAGAAGSADDAVAACSILIQSGREHGRNLAISHYNRGLALTRKGELERAIADLTQAIRIDPAYARAYNARGSAFGRKNELDRALADFNRAIELDPSFAAAYSNRGFTFARKGDLDRAFADADTAIRLDPSYARAYGTRGGVYAQRGDLDHALTELNTAIRLDPNLASAYSARASIHRKRGDQARAWADVNEAIRLDPSFSAAYNNRALLRRDQRDVSGALADLDQAIRLNPGYALAYVNRGRLLEDQGDRTRALADFNAALAIDPKHAGASAARVRLTAVQLTARVNEADRSRAAAPPVPQATPAPTAKPIASEPPARPRAPATEAAQVSPARVTPPVTASAPPQHSARPPSTTGAASAAAPVVPPVRSFTEAIDACTKGAEGVPQLAIGAAGGSGKIMIPACYKGRSHLECTMGALSEEAAAIDREYGEIVRENYPDLKDVKGVCKITPQRLADHLERSRTFNARATKVQEVFQGNSACIESVRVAMGDINLGPMRDPGGLMSVLLREVGEPVAQASDRQRDVTRLVGRIEAAREAMATVQELRQLVCR